MADFDNTIEILIDAIERLKYLHHAQVEEARKQSSVLRRGLEKTDSAADDLSDGSWNDQANACIPFEQQEFADTESFAVNLPTNLAPTERHTENLVMDVARTGSLAVNLPTNLAPTERHTETLVMDVARTESLAFSLAHTGSHGRPTQRSSPHSVARSSRNSLFVGSHGPVNSEGTNTVGAHKSLRNTLSSESKVQFSDWTASSAFRNSRSSSSETLPLSSPESTRSSNWMNTRSSLLGNYQLRRPWCNFPEFRELNVADTVRTELQRTQTTDNRVSVSGQNSDRSLFVPDVQHRCCCMISPTSQFRIVWVSLCIFLLAYDLVAVPIDLCFEPADSAYTRTMELMSAAFWTVDIVLTFFTGITLAHNFVDYRLKPIACRYLKSWLLPDIFFVLPEWLALIVGEETSQADKVSFFRLSRWGGFVRLVRLARVIRFAKIKPYVRSVVLTLHLSKPYLMLTQGWFGLTVAVMVATHLISCLWYFIGNKLDDGWVHRSQEVQLGGVGRAYVISVRWTFNRLHGLAPGMIIETTLELLVDLFLVFGSLLLMSFYMGQVAAFSLDGSKSRTVNLWEISKSFARRHKISPGARMQMMKFLEASHFASALAIKQDEAMLLEVLPETLQQDLIFEVRCRHIVKKVFFKDLFSYNQRAVRHLCNRAIRTHVTVPEEIIFASGDPGVGMYYLERGSANYVMDKAPKAKVSHVEVGEASDQTTMMSLFPTASMASRTSTSTLFSRILFRRHFISEQVLWTKWEHTGQLQAREESTTMLVNAQDFGAVIEQHKGPCVHMVKYAQHFVWNLNNIDRPHDLTEFPHLDMDAINDAVHAGGDEDHFMFISHYKVEAGTEATLLRDLLEPIIQQEGSNPAKDLKSPIFIDSEDLVDLARLKEHVMGSQSFVLLLTPGVLSRPWCLVEIVTAVKHGANIVPVEVQRPGSKYHYPDEAFYATILTGDHLNQEGKDILDNEGVTLVEVEKAIRQVFLKIALPFSPHKSKNVRDAELRDILKRCSGEITI